MCIFCKITSDEIPSSKVYEDKEFLAVLDISPANKGHILVIPKDHYDEILEMPTYLFQELMKTVQDVAYKAIVNLKAQGFNVLINNKKVAGQEISHVHVHIIPRYSNDGVNLSWKPKNYESDEEKEKYLNIITKDL